MKKQTKESFLLKLKGKTAAIFIDNANWFYPQKELGWKISYDKLLTYLRTFFKLKIVNLYAGTPLDLKDKNNFEKFRMAIEKSGVKIITKPLKKIWTDRKNGKFEYKCNFDVEIAFDIARSIEKVDIIMVGSGDSDFVEAKKFAFENKKSFMAICFEKGASWEIRKGYHLFLEDIREEIERE